jgi:hypothetical protein
VSIAVSLALRAPHCTPAWLQPVRQAFAQSSTATQAGDSQPDASPQPTAGLGEPPLRLESSASVASAAAGEQFSFTTTVIAASDDPRAVEVRASIDGQLELLSVSGGSCSSGATLSCKLSAQRGQIATIVAAVRVRPGAAAGSRLFYQALAQDDQGNTAASDQVVVTIAPAPPSVGIPPAEPTAIPTPPDPALRPTVVPNVPANGASAPTHPRHAASRPAHPAPTAAPVAPTNTVALNAPAALTPPAVPVAILRSSANAVNDPTPGDSAAPADSWLVTAPGIEVPAQALDPGLPAAVALAQPAPEVAPAAPADAPPAVPVTVAPRQIVQLPNTAAMPLIAGFVAVLLGFALILHGLRRVRRAAEQLHRQGAALGRLTTLLKADARRRASMGEGSSENSALKTMPLSEAKGQN